MLVVGKYWESNCSGEREEGLIVTTLLRSDITDQSHLGFQEPRATLAGNNIDNIILSAGQSVYSKEYSMWYYGFKGLESPNVISPCCQHPLLITLYSIQYNLVLPPAMNIIGAGGQRVLVFTID